MIDGWTRERAELLLGAMGTVATDEGTQDLGGVAKGMIDGAARHVFEIEPPTDVTVVHHDRLAAALTATDQRELATEFLTLVPYADTRVEETQVELVNGYALALGARPQALSDLHKVREGHIKRLLFDYVRRATGHFDIDTPKLKKLTEAVHQYIGDKHVAERYATLESYPEGSLGRTFFIFYRERGFPLPGEKKSLGETLTPHDTCHILSGFNTDGAGEINVAGFEAGMSVDGFGYELLLEVILDFHLGIDFGVGLVGYVPKTGEMDPDQMMLGIGRGLGCNTDLIHEFDFWGVADRPVEELRERYAITDVEGVHMPPPVIPATEPS